MRLERKMAKQAAKGLPTDLPPKPSRNQEKSLKDFINDTRPDDKHKLKVNSILLFYLLFQSKLCKLLVVGNVHLSLLYSLKKNQTLSLFPDSVSTCK